MSGASAGPVSRAALSLFALKVVDLVTYVVVLVALVFVPVAAFEVTTFGGLVFTKWTLFVVGGLLGVYASFRLRPASPKRRMAAMDAGPNDPTIGGAEVSRLQRVAAALPPARWTELSAAERFSPAAKLFWAAIAMVALAWTLETVFGVGLFG